MVPGLGHPWLLVPCLRLQEVVQVFTGAGIIWVCQVSSTSGSILLVCHVGRYCMLLTGGGMRLSYANMPKLGASRGLLEVASGAVVQDGQHLGLVVCHEHLQCGASGRQAHVPGHVHQRLRARARTHSVSIG